MNNANDTVIDAYRKTFALYGDAPESVMWSSESQQWRFDKLLEMSGIKSRAFQAPPRVLEVGCGLGHLYPTLTQIVGEVQYTGIDIVPELVAHATNAYPDARFICQDICEKPLDEKFQFVFISGLFNCPFRADSATFMPALLQSAFNACTIAMAFNFISSHVNFKSENTNYFDPQEVLGHTLKITKKTTMDHHYRNCDVAIALWK